MLAALAGRIYDHAPQQNANPLALTDRDPMNTLADAAAQAAAWIGGNSLSILALAGSAFAILRAEQARRGVVKAEWDRARQECRGDFWSSLRNAYSAHRANRSDWPADLKKFVASVGMPPGVPVPKGAEIRNWHTANQHRLTADQKKLWEFVDAVYPALKQGALDVMDFSIIDPPTRGTFHRARNALATYFYRQAQEVSPKALDKVVEHVSEDVYLLAWLELALARATEDHSADPKKGYAGKKELFEYGNYLSSRGER